MPKLKEYRIDKICDIYLHELYSLEKKNKRALFLDEVLKKKDIYYNQEIIDEVITKLSNQGMLERLEGVSKFAYARGSNSKNQPTDLSNLLQNLEGTVGYYKLSNKGSNFVLNGQRIDKERDKIIRTRKAKWVDRAVSFILGVLSTLAGKLLFEYFTKN